MKLYNTLSKKIEKFEPIDDLHVGMYACGPTVYDYTHIGHLRKYINDDLLRRVLEANRYEVKHVMNITDVGHLTSDRDAGEDKLEKGAKKFGKSVLDVAHFFEDDFLRSIDQVGIKRPHLISRATEHIDDQIALIETLFEKGYAYKTSQAIYFDVLKFPDYERLSGQKLEEKEIGARSDVVTDSKKKNPADFVLWFFTVGRFAGHILKWDSPWGKGFPGWHIECSAMSMKYLGLSFDIHTGGIDHIPVHHTNEIAQSEGATGKQFVKYWVHHAFLSVEDQKMSKSIGNILRIKDITDKGFSPLAFRYLTFQTHYRSEMNFTWDALDSCQKAIDKLYSIAASLSRATISNIDYEGKFLDAVSYDLNMPKALSIVWEMLRSGLSGSEKAATLYKMDEVLGLCIKEKAGEIANIPAGVKDLLDERNRLRKQKRFNKSDELRAKIERMGYVIEDLDKGKSRVVRRKN